MARAVRLCVGESNVAGTVWPGDMEQESNVARTVRLGVGESNVARAVRLGVGESNVAGAVWP